MKKPDLKSDPVFSPFKAYPNFVRVLCLVCSPLAKGKTEEQQPGKKS